MNQEWVEKGISVSGGVVQTSQGQAYKSVEVQKRRDQNGYGAMLILENEGRGGNHKVTTDTVTRSDKDTGVFMQAWYEGEGLQKVDVMYDVQNTPAQLTMHGKADFEYNGPGGWAHHKSVDTLPDHAKAFVGDGADSIREFTKKAAVIRDDNFQTLNAVKHKDPQINAAIISNYVDTKTIIGLDTEASARFNADKTPTNEPDTGTAKTEAAIAQSQSQGVGK